MAPLEVARASVEVIRAPLEMTRGPLEEMVDFVTPLEMVHGCLDVFGAVKRCREMCDSGCLLARPYIALHNTLAVVAQLSCDADRI